MGTARDPVVGSGSCPACTDSVARCCFLVSAILLSPIEISVQAKGPQSWLTAGLVETWSLKPSALWPVSPIARNHAHTATACVAGEVDAAKSHHPVLVQPTPAGK